MYQPGYGPSGPTVVSPGGWQQHPPTPYDGYRQPTPPGSSFGDASGSGMFGGMGMGMGTMGGAIARSYGERMQSNFSRYFQGQDLHYYFQVNNTYVLNKLKIVLCPFLHRGSWTRVPEQVAGGLTYKPPLYDINAPDLYLACMAFGTYVMMCSIAIGVEHRFTPDVVGARLSRALLAWVGEAFLLRVGLYALATPQVPLSVPFLDLLGYSGYMFVPVCVNIGVGFLSTWAYYVALLWHGMCMAMFLVKTMKRVLVAESRHYGLDSARRNYMLLALALLQFPLAAWLGLGLGPSSRKTAAVA
eukprot:jgi/Chlat1/9088/Chrsp97S08415